LSPQHAGEFFTVPATARNTPQGGINYRQPEGPAQLGCLFCVPFWANKKELK